MVKTIYSALCPAIYLPCHICMMRLDKWGPSGQGNGCCGVKCRYYVKCAMRWANHNWQALVKLWQKTRGNSGITKKHKRRTHIDLRNFEWWWKFATVHDDVIKWKHFPSCFVCRMHRSPVNSPNKGQWRGTLVFSLICVWINGWLNNRGAGDFRRHRAHYDVILMKRNGIEVVSDKVSRQ